MEMDLINELNEAIEFIEEHLEDELNLEDIAKHSSYSAYHFQRFFNYISGIPLSEYIRRRRLSRAAFELQNGEKVIDVALKYGYMSADSFTRAFTKQHGITPRECKKETISMELYPPMKFQLCIGNKVFEQVYNKHIESKGWPEYGSIYHFERETKRTLLDITQVDDVTIRPFYLDSEEIIRQLVINDQICFRDCISSVDYFMDVAKEEYIAYGAFHTDENGKEHLIGSVITEIHDDLPPEISGVMILPEYRRKHITSYMLEYTLDALNKKGHKGVWLVTPCNNEAGIQLYKKNGFVVVSKENRYMKYL